MKKNTDILSLFYILFLMFIFLSSATGGIIAYVSYILAYFLPLVLFLVFLRDKESTPERLLVLKKNDIGFVLPIFAPTVLLVIGVSVATSYIVTSITGQTNSVDLGDSLLMAIVSHALIPALFEELLFRFLPISLLGQYSRSGLVLISAVFFALIHHSLFSIPYAFVAGVIFMTVALITDSVIPTVLLHFINNTMSVLFIFYGDNSIFVSILIGLLLLLSILSVAIIFLRRKEYLNRLSKTFSGEFKVSLSPISISFILLNLLIAVFSIDWSLVWKT